MASSKKKGPVEKIALQCTECKQKNYTTEKNRRNTPNKLELMKYCPFEHKHTLHRDFTGRQRSNKIRSGRLKARTGQ